MYIGINIEEIYQKFYRELVESLPSNDPIFNSHLIKVFCGDLKGMVESQPTRAKAATWFLDNAIGPTVKCGEQEPFNVLLSVMEKFGGIHLKKLAEKIKKEVGTCETVTGEFIYSVSYYVVFVIIISIVIKYKLKIIQNMCIEHLAT